MDENQGENSDTEINQLSDHEDQEENDQPLTTQQITKCSLDIIMDIAYLVVDSVLESRGVLAAENDARDRSKQANSISNLNMVKKISTIETKDRVFS